MKSTLFTWISLLLVAMVAAQPASPFRQTSRGDIIARADRKRRLTAARSRLASEYGYGLAPRQATTSCRTYPTCSQSFRTGSNYCQLPEFDIRPPAGDLGRVTVYSQEECVKACEAKDGCVVATWVPAFTDLDGKRGQSNCYFKGNGFRLQDFIHDDSIGIVATLLGSCCDFEGRLAHDVMYTACDDNGEQFSFPICTGSRRTHSGSAIYQGVDLRDVGDIEYRDGAPLTGGGGVSLKAINRATCLAACDSIGSRCSGVVFVPGSADGNSISCYFKDNQYIGAAVNGQNPGYRNSSSTDLLLRDTSCQSQVSNTPSAVSFYCCDDPVKAYPTCPSSTGDGSASYQGYDNYLSDLPAYGSNNAPSSTSTSRADCNAKCFRDIGAACLGTTYTGGTGTNCYFKTAQVQASGFINRNYVNGGGASLIGGCSQYSSIIGDADSICCNNN